MAQQVITRENNPELWNQIDSARQRIYQGTIGTFTFQGHTVYIHQLKGGKLGYSFVEGMDSFGYGATSSGGGMGNIPPRTGPLNPLPQSILLTDEQITDTEAEQLTENTRKAKKKVNGNE